MKTDTTLSVHQLEEENCRLRAQLADTEAVLQAIQSGEIDAVVMHSDRDPQIYTLQGADHPYRVMIEAINEGAATLDEHATALYCNGRLAEMLETPLDQLIGTSLAKWIAPESQREFARLHAAARNGSCKGQVYLRTRGGAALPVLLSFSPLTIGAVELVCVVITDMSEALEHAAVAAENRRAQQADRRKDEFLAMLAHELRNPLAPLRNCVQILRSQGRGAADIDRLNGMMERQIAQLTRLVDDLLDVSRISQGKIALQKEPVDLAAIVQAAVETVQPLLSERRHELTQRLPTTPVRVEGDTARLTQVMGNILSNAAKYTEPDGQISIELEQVGDEAVVRVKDAGIGIPASLLPHIFELFVQGDRTLDRSQAGLGVGLCLVKHLIEVHRGRVSVTSELGKGSEFVVTLPLAAAPASQSPTEPQQAPSGTRKRVLVVDDNQDAATSMALLLSMDSHDVQTAHSGRSALELAKIFQPDVVLLDIGLPVMNGYEVARQLRESTEMRNIRLIALTGYGQAEDRRRSKEAGFDHHLVKPVDPDLLRTLLAH